MEIIFDVFVSDASREWIGETDMQVVSYRAQ